MKPGHNNEFCHAVLCNRGMVEGRLPYAKQNTIIHHSCTMKGLIRVHLADINRYLSLDIPVCNILQMSRVHATHHSVNVYNFHPYHATTQILNKFVKAVKSLKQFQNGGCLKFAHY